MRLHRRSDYTSTPMEPINQQSIDNQQSEDYQPFRILPLKVKENVILTALKRQNGEMMFALRELDSKLLKPAMLDQWTGKTEQNRRANLRMHIQSMKLPLTTANQLEIKALKKGIYGEAIGGRAPSCTLLDADSATLLMKKHGLEDDYDMFKKALDTLLTQSDDMAIAAVPPVSLFPNHRNNKKKKKIKYGTTSLYQTPMTSALKPMFFTIPYDDQHYQSILLGNTELPPDIDLGNVVHYDDDESNLQGWKELHIKRDTSKLDTNETFMLPSNNITTTSSSGTSNGSSDALDSFLK